jgi:hypothetical protein
MTDYRLLEKLGANLLVYHPHYGQQIWGKCTRITRRHRTDRCVLCGKMIGRQGYRPVTNAANRMLRICGDH